MLLRSMAGRVSAPLPRRIRHIRNASAIVERVTNLVKLKDSKEDIKWMQDLRALCDSLTEVKKMPKNHPLIPWTADVRRLFRVKAKSMHGESNEVFVDSILSAMEGADKKHGEEQLKAYVHINNYMGALSLPDGDPKAIRPMAEFEMRRTLLKEYLLETKKSGATGVMDNLTETKALRLIDTFLLGTSSERIAEHLSLYQSPLTCATLQDAFYVLYEPEVKLVGDLMTTTPRFGVKAHKKPLKSYLSTYLLDELELNVKTRCVFVWVGDSWREMKAIDDKDVEPIGDLLRTRRLYFEEGAGVSKALCDGYISKMRLMDYENKDWRTTVMRGWVYFFFICAADTFLVSL